MNNKITITKKEIRKIKNSDGYRMKLVYITTRGVEKMFSLIKFSRKEAERELEFRVRGLKNGGAEVVEL